MENFDDVTKVTSTSGRATPKSRNFGSPRRKKFKNNQYFLQE